MRRGGIRAHCLVNTRLGLSTWSFRRLLATHAGARGADTATVPRDMRAMQPPFEETPPAAAPFGQPGRHLASARSSGPFEPGFSPTEHAHVTMDLA